LGNEFTKFLEIEGKSIDEAIEKACLEFGVPTGKIKCLKSFMKKLEAFGACFPKKAKIKASLLPGILDFSFHRSAKS